MKQKITAIPKGEVTERAGAEHVMILLLFIVKWFIYVAALIITMAILPAVLVLLFVYKSFSQIFK